MNSSGIKNFINRRFKKLESYVDLENKKDQVFHLDIPPLLKEDIILGAYRNSYTSGKVFYISENGIYYFDQNDWCFFSYQEIRSADLKDNKKIENKTILISLKNGLKIDLLIDGERSLEGRTFYDLYDFLTFFKMFVQLK